MAFTELERKRVEKAAEQFLAARRPPPQVRHQLDFEVRIVRQSVELLEVRPRWNSPGEIIKYPVAKTTFVRTCNHWRVYWKRADRKWHAYDPPTAQTIARFFALVAADRYGCFFG